MKRFGEAVSALAASLDTEPDLDLYGAFNELGVATFEVDAAVEAIVEHSHPDDRLMHALYVGILIGQEMRS